MMVGMLVTAMKLSAFGVAIFAAATLSMKSYDNWVYITAVVGASLCLVGALKALWRIA